jgi:hypothetical protein
MLNAYTKDGPQTNYGNLISQQGKNRTLEKRKGAAPKLIGSLHIGTTTFSSATDSIFDPDYTILPRACAKLLRAFIKLERY